MCEPLEAIDEVALEAAKNADWLKVGRNSKTFTRTRGRNAASARSSASPSSRPGPGRTLPKAYEHWRGNSAVKEKFSAVMRPRPSDGRPPRPPRKSAGSNGTAVDRMRADTNRSPHPFPSPIGSGVSEESISDFFSLRHSSVIVSAVGGTFQLPPFLLQHIKRVETALGMSAEEAERASSPGIRNASIGKSWILPQRPPMGNRPEYTIPPITMPGPFPTRGMARSAAHTASARGRPAGHTASRLPT